MQPRRPEMTALEALRASSELYELDQRRADLRHKRAQERQQREVKQRLAESLRQQGRHDEADLLEAELLTNADVGDLFGIGGGGMDIRTSGNQIIGIDPATGQTRVLHEAPEDNAAPSYGTGANWVRMGQNEDGSTRWGTLRLNNQGEQEIVPLPEGAEPWSGVQNDPELIRERERARKYGGMEPEAVQGMNTQLAAAKTQLAQTNYLLKELESGKYDKDIGPIQGRIKQFFNPETALMQMYSVDAALQNLQIVNLAPVTEFELGLIMQMDANAFRTVGQNKAVLTRLKEIREAKVKALDDAMRRIRTEGYESFLRNPPELDPTLFEPISGGQGAEPAEPATTADEDDGWGPITFE
jgi:hypothetical protein